MNLIISIQSNKPTLGHTHFMGWKEVIKKTALYKEFPEMWDLFRAHVK